MMALQCELDAAYATGAADSRNKTLAEAEALCRGRAEWHVRSHAGTGTLYDPAPQVEAEMLADAIAALRHAGALARSAAAGGTAE